jgi:hypothetical protein
MSTQPEHQIRASDAERQRVVDMLQAATTDGRLTVTEAGERIATAYATTYQHELTPLTDDLPPAPSATGPRRRIHPAVTAHAAIVAVFAVGLIVRWAVSDVAFFWPIVPMFWLAMSVLVHARIRGGFDRDFWRWNANARPQPSGTPRT